MMIRQAAKVLVLIVVASLLTGCPRGIDIYLKNSSNDELLLAKNEGEKLIGPSEIVIIPEGSGSGLPLGADGAEQLRLRDSVGGRYCFRLIFSHVPDYYFSNESTQKIKLTYVGNGVIWIEPYKKQAVRNKGGVTLPTCG